MSPLRERSTRSDSSTGAGSDGNSASGIGSSLGGNFFPLPVAGSVIIVIERSPTQTERQSGGRDIPSSRASKRTHAIRVTCEAPGALFQGTHQYCPPKKRGSRVWRATH